ncbi:MAG: tRNA (adenosine(37)-N6)-threonylcarbamoyltransferase complex dimerization subunit type 1 TsaB [Clostridia bacterium]|nr:tRNA (adenosine(37)-N6)-threonylcarbamoyltransferase complex dimerization subunit type 1 TsaB [Clostridia bacterium]
MKLLALETTDRIASVALLMDGKVFNETIDSGHRHAETLLLAVERLLAGHGLEPRDMDAFAVDIGPGSFTGVRIGVTTANAFGFANDKPVIAVNSLEALALPFVRDGGLCAAVIDARNGNGYAALYRGENCLIEPCACVLDEFLKELPEGCILTGTAAEDGAMPRAESVAIIARRREGRSAVSPLYLRQAQAERLWRERG